MNSGGKFDDRGLWVPDKGLGMSKVLDYIGVDYKVVKNSQAKPTATAMRLPTHTQK